MNYFYWIIFGFAVGITLVLIAKSPGKMEQNILSFDLMLRIDQRQDKV